MRKLIFMVVLLVSLFLGISSAAANSTSTQDCQTCHSTIVQDFNKPNVAAVDKMRCYQCHSGGLHTRSYNGTKIVIVPFTDPSNGLPNEAYFVKDPNSVSTVNLHVYHSSPDSRASSSSCIQCHLSLSCTSCHQTIPHSTHSSTKYAPVDLWMTSGPFGGPATYRNSCATSNCHSTFTEPYMPKTIRDDGKQLCSNCHNADKTGHTDQQLQAAHNTTFNQSLIPQSNGENINCAGCHESSLSSEHNVNSNGCIVCHGPLTPSEVRVVVDTTNGDETKRACEKCHFNPNVLLTRTPTHQLDHVAKKSNDLNVVGGPHNTCNTCHSRTEITDTIKSLAYSNPKDYSCLDCHTGEPKPKAPIHKADYNGQQMAVLDVHSDCTSCHTPGSTYASKVGQIITNLATNPGSGYSCTVCHDNLNAGHKAKFNGVLYNDTTAFHLKCTDCHNETYKSTIATLKDQVKLNLGYDCSACHLPTGIKGTSPYEPVHQAGGDSILGYHPNSCNSCHGVVNGMYKVNLDGVRGKLPTPGYVCTDCHNGSTAGQALHQAKDENGNQYGTITLHPTCATCHSSSNATIKAVISAKRGSTTAYACNDCHTGSLQANHKAKMTVSGAVYETTGFHANCETCHNNQAVYPTITSLKGTTDYLCSACHSANGGAAAPEHQAKLTVDSAVYATTDYHANCETCHSNEQVKPKVSALRGTNGYLCAECHNGTTAPQASHSSKMSADGTTYTTTNLHPSCNTCHSNAAVKPTITSLKGQTGYLCESCHTGALQPNHKAKMTVNGAVYEITGFHASCETCHSNQAVFPTISSLKGTSEYQCSACHSTEGGAAVPGHQAKLSADGALTETTGFHPTCETCHSNIQTKPVVSNLRGTTGYLCSECHNGTAAPQASHQAKYSSQGNPSDTTNIHPTCATCHSNSQVSAKITALVGTTGYSCAECHTDIPAKHTSTLESFPVNCGWCHSSQLLDTHLNPTSVSPNMQLNGTYTCETCHAQGSQVQNQIKLGMKACLDCHNGNDVQLQHPDAQYLPRHDATGKFPVFLTQYSPDCAACHNPKAIDLHTAIPAPKGPVGCVTCHNNVANKPGVQSLSINCQGCHSETTMQGEHVKYHAVATPSASTTACLDCHKVTDTVTGTVYTGLLDVHKKDTASTVTCASCHGANARDAVKQAIANNNTNCESCHSSGGHAHNITAFETDAKVSCNECHNTDSATKSVELSKLHKDQGFDCNACHNPTFEGGSNPVIVKDGQFNLPTCSTCHDGTKAPAASTQHQGTVTSHGSVTAFGIYNDGQSQGADCSSCHTQQQTSQVHSKVACDTCHNSSVAAVKTVITNNLSTVANKPGYTCAECHNSLTANRKHAPEHQAINNIETQDITCSKCHSFNIPVAQVSGVTTLHNNNCNTCHSTTVAGVKDFISARVGQANNPAYNCNDCHSLLPKKHDKQHLATAYLSSGDSSSCATCHNTLDVSVLHKNVSGAATNCDKCHGVGASATVNGVVYGNLSTVANKPGFTCDSCHPGAQNGHMHPVTTFAASPAVSCVECHATDTAAKTAELSKLHADKGVTCSACHNPTFEGGTSPIIVKDGTMNVPACAACHDGTKAPSADAAYPAHNAQSTATHSAVTTYGTYSLAGNVNCAGCHTDKNIRPVHQATACDKCHTSTATAVQNVIQGNWSRTTNKVAYSCADCHNAVTTSATTKHKPVHSVANYTLAAGDVENCNSCHTSKAMVDVHVGKTNKAGQTMTCDTCHNSADAKVMTLINQQARSATPNYSCDSCHTLHGNGDHNATLPVGLPAEPNLKCAQCHDNDTATAGVTDLAAEHTRRTNTAGQNYTCDTCHKSTKPEVINAIATKNKNCSACHTAGWHNDLNTPHTSPYVTNPPSQCSSCHSNVLSSTALHPAVTSGGTTIGGGPVTYKIFRGTDGTNFTEIGTSSTTSFSNTGLTANTRYYYQVAAVDQNGNVSTKSNVAFADAAVQETTTTVNPTSAAYSNRSNNGDSSSDGGFYNLSPSALTRLTDSRDSEGGSYDVRVEENSSQDRWIYVRINNDAKNYTKVVLNIRASWYSSDSSGNLLIYPYQSNGTSIDTANVVNYTISNPSTNYVNYSIDVTNAAHAMDNDGFIKFRIKPGTQGSTEEAYISEVEFVLTSGTAGTSGTLPGNAGTPVITGNGGDNTPPSTPASLAAQGISTSQINLTWIGSTDPTETVNLPGQSNCLRCHDSTQPNVQTAIATKNTNCDACHTVHGDIAQAHTSTFVLNPTMDCVKCHTNRVDNEHLNRKSPTTGQQYTCDTCHKSTDPLVQGAIASNNTSCDACHPTRHSNVQSVHVSNYIPDTTVNCAACHTATSAEFTNTGNKARHVIAGTTSLATGGSYISPYTTTTVLDCRGCHKATNGTYYGKILVKPYTSSTGSSSTSSGDLCFICHDYQAYGSNGSKSSSSYSGFSYESKNLHVIGDHKSSCQACHSKEPHGQTSREHFVVLKGEAEAGTSAQLTKFIHRSSNGYNKSSCSAGCGDGDHP